MSATYSITYSVGTSRNDEKRYVIRDIDAERLSRKILHLQSNGRVIYSVERTSSSLD